MMKWKDLAPKALRGIASNLDDAAHDHNVEREEMAEEQGFDVVDAEESIARFLRREAKRRETRTAPPPLDGETYDATFHRIQDGYADGWPRVVFVDSDGEPVGVKCSPHEAAAIEAGAKALIEVETVKKASREAVAAWDRGVVNQSTAAAFDALRKLVQP